MGDMLQSLVDVTLVYPGGKPTVMDLLLGRVAEVRVLVRELPIPADLLGGDYDDDAEFRRRLQVVGPRATPRGQPRRQPQVRHRIDVCDRLSGEDLLEFTAQL